MNEQEDECLFIYGHSLSECDRHILELINNGKIKNLYISYFGDDYSHIKANANNIFTRKNITIKYFKSLDREGLHGLTRNEELLNEFSDIPCEIYRA